MNINFGEKMKNFNYETKLLKTGKISLAVAALLISTNANAIWDFILPDTAAGEVIYGGDILIGTIVNNGTILEGVATLDPNANFTNNGTFGEKLKQTEAKENYNYSLNNYRASPSNSKVINNGDFYYGIYAYGGSGNLVQNNKNIYLDIIDSKENPTEYEIVTNNFTQTKDGKIQIKVDNSVDANAPKYSQVFATDEIILEDGTTIDFNVVKNPNEKLLIGQTLENVFVVDSTTTYDYNVENLNITDNSALLNFEAVENSSYGLDFNIVEGKSIADATTPNESNSSDAAKVLDKLKDSGNNLGGFISALNSKSTDKQVAQAVKETTPVIAASIAGSTNQVQQTIGSVISGRQLGIRGIGTPSGANSGDFLQGNYSAWSKVFGAKAKQDDKDGFDGYSFDSYGVAFGADKEFGENKRFGLAFVYANGDVDTNNVEQSSSLDIYNLVAYGSTPILDKDTVFFYQLSLGLQDTQTSRKENTTNTTAKADFNGYLASASARVIRNIQINDNLLVVPTVKAMYSYIKNPSYSETGAGALNLNIDELSTDSFKVGLGADLEYKLKDGYTLLSNAMLHYDIEEASNVSTSSYSGNSSLSFTTKGMENDKLSYEAGVGIKKSINEDTDFRFEYNYEGRDSTFSNQTISAKLSWKF